MLQEGADTDPAYSSRMLQSHQMIDYTRVLSRRPRAHPFCSCAYRAPFHQVFPLVHRASSDLLSSFIDRTQAASSPPSSSCSSSPSSKTSPFKRFSAEWTASQRPFVRSAGSTGAGSTVWRTRSRGLWRRLRLSCVCERREARRRRERSERRVERRRGGVLR
jgi:hypothetical protein